MTDTAEVTPPEPTFSDAEVAEFEVVDKDVGKTIGVMLAVLFSLFVPLMFGFWLGVGTVSAIDDDKNMPATDSSEAGDAAGGAEHKPH